MNGINLAIIACYVSFLLILHNIWSILCKSLGVFHLACYI